MAKGGVVKKQWQPMRLRLVGRVSELMQGMNGSNHDSGQSANTKKGNG
jgi:hypothetical protein